MKATFRKAIRRVCRDSLRNRVDQLRERAILCSRIARLADRGRIYVYQWSRDCDCVEADRVFDMPASVVAFERARDRMYEGAEGPCGIDVISRDDYETFRPIFRDRVLEAFERGNTYCV